MPARYRLLAIICGVLLWLGFMKWLVLIVLGLIALGFTLTHAGAGLPWLTAVWAPVLMLLAASIIATALDYTVFVPDPAMGQVPPDEPRANAPGLATGLFQVWNRFEWVAPELIPHASVQVRWLDRERPPVLAVIRPADLPEDLPEPLKEADEYCLWHPGVDVVPGRLVTMRTTYPALRLSFVGKSMVLAVGSEATAVSYMHALRG